MGKPDRRRRGSSRLTPEERTLREVPENDLQSAVFEAMGYLGWVHYHVRFVFDRESRKPSLGVVTCKGFPDCVAFHRKTSDMIAVEFKREIEHPTAEQLEWLSKFEAFGIDSYVIRPSDEDFILDRLRNPKPPPQRVRVFGEPIIVHEPEG